ncbi:hypothetical protein [Cellulomonas marina]|uniref:Uncharacterized protein n=1 Tax=Cellulomonas marina TaxID=988821 RepID=A0A1I0Y464_9CELL|nr:hypothetical protein [Cellulomonas marina]GIG29779.1 hypothetical protein Cma02nite_23790 [Cellulomonas marina]SFB07944.1 hypothetical protein SAMN05421867_106162 [Cellulomonas marina]
MSTEVRTVEARSRQLRYHLDRQIHRIARPGPVPASRHLERALVVARACPPGRGTHLAAAGTATALFAAAFVPGLAVGGAAVVVALLGAVLLALMGVVVVELGWRTTVGLRLSRRATRAAWLAERGWRAGDRILEHRVPRSVRAARRSLLIEIERARVAVDGPAAVLPAPAGADPARWASVSGAEPEDVLEGILLNDVALLAEVADRLAAFETWPRERARAGRTVQGAWEVLRRP